MKWTPLKIALGAAVAFGILAGMILIMNQSIGAANDLGSLGENLTNGLMGRMDFWVNAGPEPIPDLKSLLVLAVGFLVLAAAPKAYRRNVKRIREMPARFSNENRKVNFSKICTLSPAAKTA
jgi:hypothetical protein